jgi:hypothetical protein
MLYMLVACAGTLCLPVETAGAYTLTRDDGEARMMQMRVAWHGADVRCFSDASWGYGDEKWVLREHEFGMVIVH